MQWTFVTLHNKSYKGITGKMEVYQEHREIERRVRAEVEAKIKAEMEAKQ